MSTTITIQRGQTLSSIAAKYGTTVDALAKANHLSNPDRIIAGEKLVVPDRFEGKGHTQKSSGGASSSGDKFDARSASSGGKAGEVRSSSGRKFPTSADGTPMFRQGDPEWGGRTLGHSRTISQAGCAMTATAMAISKISGKVITPGQLDAYLDKHGGYSGDGLYWDKAAQMAGLHGGPAAWSLNTINKQVEAGRPVVVGVDYHAGSGGGANGTDHYVTITGHKKVGGKDVYTANDPATGKGFTFHREGNQLVADSKAWNGNHYRTTGVLRTFTGGPAHPTGPGGSTGGTGHTGSTGGTGGTGHTGGTSFKAPQQDLTVGSQGAAVEQLQKDLVHLGLLSQKDMNTGPGHYGPHTQAAVAKLQERYGIHGDSGEHYGPKTRAALEKALEGKGPTQGGGHTGGTGGTTGGTHTGGTSSDKNLGKLSARYESNGNPGTVSSGVGDAGGVSYGTYQFASKTGSAQSFTNWLKTSHPDYYRDLAGKTPGSAAYSAAWKKVAARDPKGFGQAQHDYIKAKFYEPAKAHANQIRGLDMDHRSQALKDVLWSTAVQHGSANTIFNQALAGKDVSKMTDAQIIKAIYAERGRKDSHGNLVHFSHNSHAVQQSVANRFVHEQADALAMLRAEGRS